MDMTRCLLIQSSLPPSFWGEAINAANHIRNRCPSRSLGGKTPFEKWTGKVPDVSHLQEFGSRVFTLNREPTKGKLDPRSKRGIFVGYSSESNGYRIWLPDEKRVDIARDVKFVGTLNNPSNDESYDAITIDEVNDSSQTEIIFLIRSTKIAILLKRLTAIVRIMMNMKMNRQNIVILNEEDEADPRY